MNLGTIAEINCTANRVAVLLGNGLFAVCRLLDPRGDLQAGETVRGRLANPGASMLTSLSSEQTYRALVLAVFQSKDCALEMVHG